MLIHCGDYCGGTVGHKTLTATVKMIRDAFPDITYASVIGNHDVWCAEKMKRKYKTSQALFDENYEKILKTFDEHNVFFFDEDGIFKPHDHPDILILGQSGWYTHPNPPTNDSYYLPTGAHEMLRKRAHNQLHRDIDALDKIYEEDFHTVVFVSHFPVVKGFDYKGGFEDFSWSENISKFFIEHYNCKYFLNGHAHQYHNGENFRYESGSDYGNPEAHIVNVF